MQRDYQLDVGVIGVGSMGKHHARVYSGLPAANLVGVFDVDKEQARAVARSHDALATGLDSLLESVDAVSIAAPTSYHYQMTIRCLEAGVAALIEKPVVKNVEKGQQLQSAAADADVPVQVGHIERFNPAVTTLKDIVDNREIINITSRRLGPPPDRDIEDTAVLDLMIHDIDVVLALLDEEPIMVQSTGVANDDHVSSLLEFESGSMASLTASRVTQRKVRKLEVTTEEGLFELDFLDQSIEIHRQSVPEYVAENGDVRFRHESIVERPHVPNEEPLRNELASFLEVVAANEEPRVTIDDGLAALEIAREIEDDEEPNRSVVETESTDD